MAESQAPGVLWTASYAATDAIYSDLHRMPGGVRSWSVFVDATTNGTAVLQRRDGAGTWRDLSSQSLTAGTLVWFSASAPLHESRVKFTPASQPGAVRAEIEWSRG